MSIDHRMAVTVSAQLDTKAIKAKRAELDKLLKLPDVDLKTEGVQQKLEALLSTLRGVNNELTILKQKEYASGRIADMRLQGGMLKTRSVNAEGETTVVDQPGQTQINQAKEYLAKLREIQAEIKKIKMANAGREDKMVSSDKERLAALEKEKTITEARMEAMNQDFVNQKEKNKLIEAQLKMESEIEAKRQKANQAEAQRS